MLLKGSEETSVRKVHSIGNVVPLLPGCFWFKMSHYVHFTFRLSRLNSIQITLNVIECYSMCSYGICYWAPFGKSPPSVSFVVTAIVWSMTIQFGSEHRNLIYGTEPWQKLSAHQLHWMTDMRCGVAPVSIPPWLTKTCFLSLYQATVCHFSSHGSLPLRERLDLINRRFDSPPYNCVSHLVSKACQGTRLVCYLSTITSSCKGNVMQF